MIKNKHNETSYLFNTRQVQVYLNYNIIRGFLLSSTFKKLNSPEFVTDIVRNKVDKNEESAIYKKNIKTIKRIVTTLEKFGFTDVMVSVNIHYDFDNVKNNQITYSIKFISPFSGKPKFINKMFVQKIPQTKFKWFLDCPNTFKILEDYINKLIINLIEKTTFNKNT